MHTATVIQFSKQQTPRRPLGGDHFRRSGLPPMLLLTPWWPVLLGLQFWSDVLAAHATALEGSQTAREVMPMAASKARRAS